MGELTVAPSVGELITTSVDEVGAGAAGGLAVDDPALEPALLVGVPLELLPEPELAPGAGETPVLPADPTEDTFAFVELSVFV